MKYTLIIEKKKTCNSATLIKLLGVRIKYESFCHKLISTILSSYEKDTIERIIFHASGRDGVKCEEALQHLEIILKWKNDTTLLYAVSEGDDHRTGMREAVKNYKNAYTNSYTSYVKALKENLERLKNEGK